MMMLGLVGLLLVPAQVEIIQSADFPRKIQTTAITATVRIGNKARNTAGSGVIVGRKGEHLYILTAKHLIAGNDGLEIATFSIGSYPQEDKVYRSCEIVARSKDITDLALIRIATKDAPPGSLPLCPERVVPTTKGFPALSVGCSKGEAPSCRVDTVLGKKVVRRKGQEQTGSFWEVGRKLARGRSGGPLVDKRGYLLGVLSGTNKDKSYFCHTAEIRAFLKKSGFE